MPSLPDPCSRYLPTCPPSYSPAKLQPSPPAGITHPHSCRPGTATSGSQCFCQHLGQGKVARWGSAFCFPIMCTSRLRRPADHHVCAAWLLDQVEPAIMGKGGEPTLHPPPTKYRPVHFPRLLAVVVVGAAKGWARDRNGRHLSTLLLARLPSFQLCLTCTSLQMVPSHYIWYLPSHVP